MIKAASVFLPLGGVASSAAAAALAASLDRLSPFAATAAQAGATDVKPMSLGCGKTISSMPSPAEE
jgi:hypothetical protein